MKSTLRKWINTIALVSNICSLTVLADTTSSLSPICIPGSSQTAFPDCNHFLNFGNTCPNLPTDQEWKECICNQDYVNSLFGCQNEMRACFQDENMDITYQAALSLFHSLCNTFLPSSVTVTTPPLSTITADYLAGCQAEQEACQTVKLRYDNCSNSFTNFDAPFTSCICQPKWLSLDYQCEFIGNTSCVGIPATLSNLIGYGCPNFQDVIGTGVLTSGSVVTLSGPSRTSSLLITPSPSRTATTASQTAVAATTKSSVGASYGGFSRSTCVSFSCLLFLYVALT